MIGVKTTFICSLLIGFLTACCELKPPTADDYHSVDVLFEKVTAISRVKTR